MTLEEQIQAYHELGRQIVEMEEKKKELGLAILSQVSEKTLTTPNYTVRRYERISIKTSLEDARQLHATKTEEVLDKDRLKELHLAGQAIPGISTLQYIQVKKRSENGERETQTFT